MFLVPLAFADDLTSPPEALVQDARPKPDVPATGLRFLGIAAGRVGASDIGSTNPFLNGQVVGELGGTNSTTTQEEVALATEERVGAFFTYTPSLWDGRLSLDAAFEVDFAFGDSAYGIGGNTGGGFGGDQVNLQTRRLGVRARVAKETWVVGGLQFVSDGSVDPTKGRPDDLFRTGGHLMFFGSEAAGITVYGQPGLGKAREPLRYKLGAYTLSEGGLAAADDVTLYMADGSWAPAYAQRLGLHLWYLRDKSGGSGGVLGQGVTSALSELQGGPRLDFRENETDAAPEVSADLVWIGVDHSWNAALDRGPVGASALVVASLGRLYVTDLADRDVRGFLGDLEIRGRYAEGEGSVARIEAVYSTEDDADTPTYEGIVTGNSYGAVGAVYGTHGTLLLFPDIGAINRQVAQVYDVSGKGEGVLGITGGVGLDVIRNKLTVGVGGGHARDADMNPLGTEINARISGRPWTLVDVGVSGAVLLGSEFTQDPWVVYTNFQWVVI